MNQILEVVLPVFGLVLLGFAVGRPPLFGAGSARALGTFVFYLALPALLFRSMAQRGLPGRDELAFFATYYLALVVTAVPALVFMRGVFREPLAEAATLTLGAIFSNLVLIGIPLAVPAFGQRGLPLVLLIVTCHAVTLIGSATVMVEMSRAGGGKPLAILGRTVLALLKNPIILAILAGTAWGATGIGLPVPLDRTISMLSAASVPCALFALGADLVGIRVRGLLGRTLAIVAIKQMALPCVVWLIGTYVFALPPFELGVAVVLGTLPVGLNVFIFAQRYGIHVGPVASAVLVSTAISALTTTMALLWFVPQPSG
ncbi:AEC family transporter [Arenibaculum pallidiluteum]|uniref:AEC family transporter n=1 Tax=Arenibaculum pallidiluteum TaxID=2812559 RepID=UPI001A97CA82|nr:AEC family transporter [Arenibaculum pallidiluteum]